MVTKKDSIFAPRSRRNLLVTTSLAMALGMGVAPGIAFAEELPADDAAPTITRVDAAAPVEETAIVASVEPAAADTSWTIYRTNDALTAAGDTYSYHSDGSHTSGYSGGYSGGTYGYTGGNSPVFVTEGNNRYSDSSSNLYNGNNYNRHDDSGYWLDEDYPYSPTVQVIGDYYSRDDSSQTVTPVNHEAVSLSRGNEDKQSVEQPAQPVSDAEAQTKVATEQLSSFVSDAASASDFASQLGVESVKVVGEPELKQIADGVFEVEKMPKLEVEDAEIAKPEGLDYWWCVYIDGAKTKVMDAIGNLAEGIDNLLWSPEGTVDPTTFEGELVFAQNPGMTVVMTASSELGVEAVTEPAQFVETTTPSVVTDSGVKDDGEKDGGTTGTDVASTSSDPLPSTGSEEPTVSLGERMAAYIPNQVAETPAVAAAAEAVESLAVTADHTDARPVVAWGVAGVATLIFATLRKRHEER